MPLAKAAPHSEITFRIIGVAMEVHNKLGPGHPEEVYQKALELKLPETGLSFEGQKPVQVVLDGTALALYYLDLLVEERVIVEVKALSERMSDKDLRQVIKYFAATDCPVALWINFGRKRLNTTASFRRRRSPAIGKRASGNKTKRMHPLGPIRCTFATAGRGAAFAGPLTWGRDRIR